MALVILSTCLVACCQAANVAISSRHALQTEKASPGGGRHDSEGRLSSFMTTRTYGKRAQSVGSLSQVAGQQFTVAIGALSGTIIGAVVGAAGGYAADMPVPGSIPYASFTGGAAGGVVGGIVGGVAGWAFEPSKAGAKEEAQEVKEEPKGNVTELPEPALEKLHQLALTAVALSDYEESRAKLKGNDTERRIERAAEKKAVKALEDIVERMNTSKKEPMNQSEGDFEDIQEVLSEGDTAEFVTAESSMANNALVTANDLARVETDKNGTRLRGEDLGPVGDLKSYQGDMVPESAKQLSLFQSLAAKYDGSSAGNPKGVAAGASWKDGKVKFCFASDVSAQVKHIFLAATNQFHVAVPCLQFIDVGLASGSSTSPESDQRCNEAPAIFVQSNPAEGCYSYVGMVEWKASQKLQLQDPGCLSIGTAIHELGHALGMAHEQSRPDRNKYVKIHWNNIQTGQSHNFDIVDNAFTDASYDLLSIMHYDRYAFARDQSSPTIEYIGSGVHDELGQRSGLSTYDVEQMVAMYRTEDRDCKGNALAGMGCVNKPDDNGQDPCNIKKCNSMAATHCCACGGGVQVQCYENQPCPKSEPLPDLDASECIDDATHLFAGQGYPCIYQNVCKFNVEFKCPGFDCMHKVRPKNYEAAMCNNQYQTKICSARKECKVYKM